jgi:parvulin-like peptidyl-prolyl isomerase
VNDQALAEAVLERELKSTIAISDAQVEDFYKTGSDLLVTAAQLELARMSQNPKTTLGDMAEAKRQTEELRKTNLARLEQPEKVRVSHILIATRQKDSEEELPPEQKKSKRELAQKLLARVKAGEDFSKLIKEFSEDRGLKETGGEYTFSRNDPFIPEFKAASFSLATNQISDLVTTVFGYHIIKLLEKIPARKVEFDKVKAEIKNLLLQQELQKQMPGYFQRLKKEAGVEVLDARYKLEPSKTANPLKPDN